MTAEPARNGTPSTQSTASVPAGGSLACRVCGSPHGTGTFVAREMMFGSREPFDYFECWSCGTIQIGEIPRDLARHYPADYYSYGVRVPGRLERWFKQRRGAWVRGARWDLVGRLMVRRYGRPDLLQWMASSNTGANARILDVGTGAGQVPLDLEAAGWRHVTGIDPFVETERTYRGTIRILRRSLDDVGETYDLVMFHHSLEHMPDPLGALQTAARQLTPGGTILVRLPIAGAYGWRTYGTDWVALDPPRHLVIPSERAMHVLAERAGLAVVDSAYDSTEYSFYGSEQCRAGIPLRDPRSWGMDPARSMFGPADIERFRRRAAELNAARDGDTAAFYLRPARAAGARRDGVPLAEGSALRAMMMS